MVFSRRIAGLFSLVPILFTFLSLPAQESGEHTPDRSTATARKSAASQARPERAAEER